MLAIFLIQKKIKFYNKKNDALKLKSFTGLFVVRRGNETRKRTYYSAFSSLTNG